MVDDPRIILLVGGPSPSYEQVQSALQRRGYPPRSSTSVRAAIDAQAQTGADLIVALLPLPDASGKSLIDSLKQGDRRVPIIISGQDDEILGAPEAMEHGAFEYLPSASDDLPRFLSVVGQALEARRSDVELRYLRGKDDARSTWQTLIGESPAMKRVFATVRMLGHRPMKGPSPTVLLSGETGTGKGMIAKAMHYLGPRRSGPFVEVNCAALPPTLIEAELFGHERGAFTDARTARAGLFETAAGGTLFLDEISAMPLEVQAKLLTAIESKSIRRVGANKAVNVDVHIITASNLDLNERVRAGAFREDLYHRLSVVTVDLPPLRERGQDCVRMAESFLAEMCREYGHAPKTLSPGAVEAIIQHAWPGNVRELRNRIERIVLLSTSDVVEAEDFDLRLTQPQEAKIDATAQTISVALPKSPCSLDDIERAVIAEALRMHQGNLSQTARYLGVSRYLLRYRLRKHGLAPSGIL